MIRTTLRKLQRGFFKVFNQFGKENKPDSISQSESTSSKNFINLTPENQAEGIDCYTEALEYALDKSHGNAIKNIAITGPFASGKSSFIQSFQNIHTNYHYLNISLATFSHDQETTQQGVATKDIEKSIIQQMIYKVNAENIPNSRFHRIIDSLPSNTESGKHILAASIWIIATLYLISPRALVFTDILALIDKSYKSLVLAGLSLITTTIFAIGIFYLVRKFIYLVRINRINKVNLITGEIAVQQSNCESILNTQIEEIIYFFAKTDYNVVVIEDLDRFNNVEIFIRLRELNTLINNCDAVGQHVYFVYAIKDDMFSGKDRTKFFDFILPIIPIINSSNSFTAFKTELTNFDLTEGISDDFIKDLTIYIDDMRVLKNIVNEFKIYRAKLAKGIPIKLDKLLAFIVYKNIYPTDFAALNEHKGIVAEVFATKNKIVAKRKIKHTEIIADITKKINLADTELVENLKELRSIFIFKVLNESWVRNAIELGNFSLATLVHNEEDFENISNNKYVNLHLKERGSTNSNNVLYGSKPKYEYRKQILENKSNEQQHLLMAEIQHNKEQITNLTSLTVSEFCEKYEQNEVFDQADFSDKKLLKYLISRGYIDEQYAHYISIFYDGSISQNDYVFVLSVKNKEPLGFDYSLDCPRITEAELHASTGDYRHTAIANYDLFDYLLNCNKTSELASVFTLFVEDKVNFCQFYDGFIQYTHNKEWFIKRLASDYESLLLTYINNNETNALEVRKFIILLLTFVGAKRLKDLRQSVFTAIVNFINEDSEFIHFIDTNYSDQPQLILNDIRELEVEFDALAIYQGTSEAVEFVIANSLYALNVYMIDWVINYVRHQFFETFKTNCNYSDLLATHNEPLIDNIDMYLDRYVSEILFSDEKVLPEVTDAFVDLLNKKSLANDNKLRLIERQRQKIDNLADVNDSTLYLELISHNLVESNWANIYLYLSKVNAQEKASREFWSYMNNSASYLAKSDIDDNQEYCEEISDLIARNLLTNSAINEESLTCLIEKFSDFIDISRLDIYSKQKLEILLKKRFIEFNIRWFKYFEEEYPSLFPLYVELYLKQFLQSELAESKRITLIASYILQNNMINVDDYEKIVGLIDLQVFDEHADLEKLITVLYAKSKIFKEIFVPFKSLKVMLHHGTVESRIDLYIQQLNYLNKEDALLLLTFIGRGYADIGNRRYVAKLIVTSYNTRLVTALHQQGIISSYSVKDGILRINAKRK